SVPTRRSSDLRQAHELALDLFPFGQRIQQQAVIPIDRDHHLTATAARERFTIACGNREAPLAVQLQRADASEHGLPRFPAFVHNLPLFPTWSHYSNAARKVSRKCWQEAASYRCCVKKLGALTGRSEDVRQGEAETARNSGYLRAKTSASRRDKTED